MFIDMKLNADKDIEGESQGDGPCPASDKSTDLIGRTHDAVEAGLDLDPDLDTCTEMSGN